MFLTLLTSILSFFNPLLRVFYLLMGEGGGDGDPESLDLFIFI